MAVGLRPKKKRPSLWYEVTSDIELADLLMEAGLTESELPTAFELAQVAAILVSGIVHFPATAKAATGAAVTLYVQCAKALRHLKRGTSAETQQSARYRREAEAITVPTPKRFPIPFKVALRVILRKQRVPARWKVYRDWTRERVRDERMAKTRDPKTPLPGLEDPDVVTLLEVEAAEQFSKEKFFHWATKFVQWLKNR